MMKGSAIKTETQTRQDSFQTLSSLTDMGFCDPKDLSAVKPKPRRRNGDSAADGLDILIQKTKNIGLRAGEEGLVKITPYEQTANENGNEWLEALSCRGEKLLWGVTKIRKFVCGDGSDTHAEG